MHIKFKTLNSVLIKINFNSTKQRDQHIIWKTNEFVLIFLRKQRYVYCQKSLIMTVHKFIRSSYSYITIRIFIRRFVIINLLFVENQVMADWVKASTTHKYFFEYLISLIVILKIRVNYYVSKACYIVIEIFITKCDDFSLHITICFSRLKS